MAFPARALPRTLSPRVLRPHALRLKQWQCRQIASAAAATEYREPEPFVHEGQQTPQPSRQAKIRQAKPFSEFLTDNFDRQHDYLRISLTERCNLRCTYCMPEEGIQLSPNKDILTTAEIQYISALFVNQGVNKIRLTGGEPTVRKDIIPLMQQIGSLRSNGLKELALTTNGISLHRKLDDMVAAGLTGVNISLDTLDPFQFQILTRRQGFSAVMKSIERVKEMNRLGAGIKLKINCVMMRGLNDHQLLPFVEMTQNEDVEVRFIEYMPFGGNKWNKNKMMSYEDMLDAIRVKYPDIGRLKDARNDTSKTWQVPGFVGRVGFITSMTHNFCGSCNRLRITSDGNLKVCLHGETEVSLRDLLRKDHGGEPMDAEAFEAIRQLELDRRSHPGLRFDGEEGWMSKEQQLLDVIGAAVKRKKAKHAGIGQLENMKNRPMILIGDRKHAVPPPRPRHAQRNPITPANPWSRIPTHMLGTPTPGAFSQMRAYSSDSKSDADGGFVFQSLGPLFPVAPAPGRYSRPKERRAEDAASAAIQEKAPEVSNQKDSVSEGPLFVSAPEAEKSESVSSDFGMKENPALRTTSVSTPETPAQATEKPTSATRRGNYDMKEVSASQSTGIATTETPTQSQERPTSAPPRRGRERGPAKIRQVAFGSVRGPVKVRRTSHGAEKEVRTSDAPAKKVASPFATKVKTGESSKNGTAETLRDTKAWGLQEDEDTSAPAAKSATHARQTKSKPASESTADQERTASADVATIADSNNNRLTHVKPSGEAHMVDIGAKPHTRRVAIAVAHIRIGRQLYDQIEQHTNKKGDVLGVARIAGIMAAKRTSDIIPLCHPLAISKAEVDVYLVPAGRSSSLWNENGPKVAVQARVECVGPTGVEMEAMTAVQGAALTVYDMCKAVSKTLVISNARVVYKAGGRSGVSINLKWKKDVGEEKFGEDGELKDDADVLLGRD